MITSLIVAVATWLALSYLGLKQAAIWGVAAGVFNTIPYFGAILVTAALAVVAFLQFGTLAMAAYVAGVAFVAGGIAAPGFSKRPRPAARVAPSPAGRAIRGRGRNPNARPAARARPAAGVRSAQG